MLSCDHSILSHLSAVWRFAPVCCMPTRSCNMHLFAGSYDSAVVYDMYQWNAVEVLINGALQHGVVVGLASGDNANRGLLIDFDCPQRHSEFATFDSIFSGPYLAPGSWDAWKKPAWAEKHPLQALMRVGRDRAWTWCPVKFILPENAQLCKALFSDIRCGLVEVQWGDAQTKELIPLPQIRGVPSPEDLQVRRGHPESFVSRECRLPRGYWSAPPEATRRLWERLGREFSACCIAVRTECFTYFQRHDELPISPDRLDSTFDYFIQHPSTHNSGRGETEGRPEGEWINRRFVPPLRRVKAPPTEAHRTSRGIPLASEILSEVFQSLDSVERVRKRRVCRLWEAVLDAGALGNPLWISCRYPFHTVRDAETEQFILAGGLLKYATPTTDTVILEDSLELAYRSRDVYELLTTLVQSRRFTTLVLSRCDFSDQDFDFGDYLEWINERLSAVAATCSVVVWRDCKMALTYTSAQVTFARFDLRDTPARRLAQLWEVYERSLVSPEVIDVPRLAAWVARCVSAPDTDACFGILLVLNEYVGADPRTLPPRSAWTMENLIDLDVFSLPRVAQFALYSMTGES
ncbi:uncharacterized protein LOC129591022 [Paramacrobiotus metropolitanus]|uniref:uncharacterized protein LOC129591022 n=1 Tax=Paramacrobiotus metropolitanus TaxID=2943436 RepID=UPI0024463EC8|nr:uncharacterized protein LOC129591022 [Paramacrobiotus metropolitanus]